jgi:histidine ammonia-lyase
MSHLWDAFFENLTRAESSHSMEGVPEFFGMSLRYTAAAVLAELKQLAAPATPDWPPLDIGTEATSAPLGVRKADSALEFLEDLIVVELIMAHDALATMPTSPRLGSSTEKALRKVKEVLAAPMPDRSPHEVHRALRSSYLAPELDAVL